MRKVDLVIYLQSIGVKVTTTMKAKKDNLVQEVYNHFDWKTWFIIWIEIQFIKVIKTCCVSFRLFQFLLAFWGNWLLLSGNGLNFLRGRGSSKKGTFLKLEKMA